ncbi:cortactin-binding protein 2-like [Lingula anatina]|uniref:Cortactin-binding protein 2-like n=1 Tax=Lingula anatina TaxID=7574 RepID=A0A1S3GZ56_LINAN|nr:cortactin-binding protein 2-like [Lingula anatina]|eukprot:XP_013378957.1 cortactin-binding protein 2-like [Lingula anatina]
MRLPKLHEATREENVGWLQQLLTAGKCEINEQAWDGNTPLHEAAWCGHTQCVKLLLQHGADTTMRDRDGRTPLHEAACNGRTQCARLLLQQGADTRIQDKSGRTPLHLAAYCGHTHCVQLFLQHGMDTSIQDVDKKTARMVAEEEGHSTEAELLRRFEIPNIKVYILTRTLEHLDEVIDSAEYSTLQLDNSGLNFPGDSKFENVQKLKKWAISRNCTTIRCLQAKLRTANLPRLSSAALDYSAMVVMQISDMTSNEFEALCRTLTTASGLSDTSSSLDHRRCDALIVYSGNDKDVVEPVVQQLEEQGVRCCYSGHDFRLGNTGKESFEEALCESKCTIVFLSKSSWNNQFCKKKWIMALSRAIHKREYAVIPVIFDLPRHQIPSYLKYIKPISAESKNLIPKLVEAVKDKISN